jgi:hypothetical protein
MVILVGAERNKQKDEDDVIIRFSKMSVLKFVHASCDGDLGSGTQ